MVLNRFCSIFRSYIIIFPIHLGLLTLVFVCIQSQKLFIVNSNPDRTLAPLTVYFDGGCPVCSREIAHYRRQPGAEVCAWVDASRCADAELGAGLTRAAALGRFHVRRADGELVDGMRGFATLWRVLPRSAWLGRIASFGPMLALLEFAYQGFLVMRRAWRPRPAALPQPEPGAMRPRSLDVDPH